MDARYDRDGRGPDAIERDRRLLHQRSKRLWVRWKPPLAVRGLS